MTSRPYIAIARQYEADVMAGVIPACKWVRLAVARNMRDLARANTEAFPYRFDDATATRFCMAAERFPHIKGPKAQIVGRDEDDRPIWATIVLEPWQCWLLTTAFGWLQMADNLRRFRIMFPLIPRKNAKSTIGAIVVLVMLTMDGESGAECVSAATALKQSKVVAEIAWHMAKRSPQFCEYFGVRIGSETTFTLSVPTTASKFEPLSADAGTLDALNISLAVIDELHAHKTRAIWDVLDSATGARLQPVLFPITTAGIDIGGICYEKLTYLKQVLEGALTDETFFGVYFTIDDGDDIRDPVVQRKANPNYGVSVQPDDLVRKIQGAQHSPSALNNVLTKHFNVYVRAESTWMPMAQWIALGSLALKIDDFKDVPCWIGVDLAEVRDIAALVAIFRPDPKHYVWFGRYYLPQETLDKSPIAQMSGWANEKHLIVTDGNQANFQRIEDDIIAWCDLLTVREIDFDRALAAHMSQNLKTRLQPRMGKDAVEKFVITVPQNVETMNPAMQLMESLTLSSHIQHDGNPANNWMWSNVVVERNYKDEVYPRKAGGKDSPHKIDGPVAGLTAISRAAQAVLAKPRKRKGALVYTRAGFVPALPPAPAPNADGDQPTQ